MHRHFATVCKQNHTVFIKMLKKCNCLTDNAKSVSGCYIVFDKQPKLDTCYERRHPVCEHDTSDSVEDRLLIKTSQTEKAGLLKNDCWVSSETVKMAYAVWSLTNTM